MQLHPDKEEAIKFGTEFKTKGLTLMEALDPSDTHEAVLTQHMVLAQEWMRSCCFRASQYLNPDHPNGFDNGIKMANLATKFMSIYTKQLEALDRHRMATKNIKSSNVQVNDGGQAIVGDVTINQATSDEK